MQTNANSLPKLPPLWAGSELMKLDFPEPEHLLGKWLPSGSLCMIYGSTGIGKSWFAMSVALAVANGRDLLDWEASEPRRVAYFEAEMNQAETKSRLVALNGGPLPDFFMLCSGTGPQGALPSIDDREAQDLYLEQILEHDIEVVVFDNLCSIVTEASISEDTTWLPVQSFFRELQSAGITVLLVHHAGKNGDYLGTSRMTQNMNTVIEVSRPQGTPAGSGAVIEIVFKKDRGGGGNPGQTLKLIEGETGGLGWQVIGGSSVDPVEEAIEALETREFANQQELADHLGISQPKLSGLFSKAMKNGRLEQGEHNKIFHKVRTERKTNSEQDE
ncbi:AAA family ATPase [uncultured Cohaesibacter sp.]|uniref:AAA family ATPase n=1 Tax=uncultured Cohaesibacter sp. TaxID=1002546 RepID=UPI002AAB86F1|nr:AAA family ATPase [uncultured Cohaesibacter sp.]